MTQLQQLKRRIEMLEARLQAVEARPIYFPVAVPTYPTPYYQPVTPWCGPHWGTTTGLAMGIRPLAGAQCNNLAGGGPVAVTIQ